MAICNMDCENCVYSDCINEDLTQEERMLQNQQDTEIRKSRKYGRSLVVWNYQHSEKGKEAARRYAQSEKGKENQKRYLQSEKGKAKSRRKTQRDIESGKNAAKCRAYYQRKKAERMAIGA